MYIKSAAESAAFNVEVGILSDLSGMPITS